MVNIVTSCSSIFLPSRTCKSSSKKENKKGSSGCPYLWQSILFSFSKAKRNQASLLSSLAYGTLLFLNTTHPYQLYSLLSFLKFSALAFCSLLVLTSCSLQPKKKTVLPFLPFGCPPLSQPFTPLFWSIYSQN